MSIHAEMAEIWGRWSDGQTDGIVLHIVDYYNNHFNSIIITCDDH